MKSFGKILVTIVLVISLAGATGCSTGSVIATDVQYLNPLWAPLYHPGVRYYYLPDIEVYYDLSNQSFVYFQNGQWLFSNALPPIYGGFDLYGGFVIALNFGVYQPWKYHHYYVSHYPRYYYNDFYRRKNLSATRGFNENSRKRFLWQPGERKGDHDRKDDEREKNRHERTPEISRPPRNSESGEKTGRPVKVRPEMREPKQEMKRPDRRQ